MTFTYKFYDKAEDAKAIDIMTFEGSTEQEIDEQVHDYCDTYGYEAFTLINEDYKDSKYWEAIREQEEAEEKARCEAKYEMEKQAEKPAKKEWTQEEIKNLIQTNDTVLYRALRKLYNEQTSDEQRNKTTKVRNNAGFNALDAKFLSSVANFLNAKGFLTDNQKAVVRRKLVKYTAQLTRLANA